MASDMQIFISVFFSVVALNECSLSLSVTSDQVLEPTLGIITPRVDSLK